MKITVKPYEVIHRCTVEYTTDAGRTVYLYLTIFKNLKNGNEEYEVTDGDGAYVSNEMATAVVDAYENEHKLYL